MGSGGQGQDGLVAAVNPSRKMDGSEKELYVLYSCMTCHYGRWGDGGKGAIYRDFFSFSLTRIIKEY